MEETNAAVLTAEHAHEPEVPAENLIPPIPLDIGGKFGADISPWETPAPDIAGGDVVVLSKVIDGLFEERRAAAKEVEKQAAEQDKVVQDTPTGDEAPAKKGRGGRPPKADKVEKAVEAKKPKRGGRPPKALKEEKAVNSGTLGGISGPSAGKDEAVSTPTPVVPALPPPPRDATRPGETETIVYINHADLHPFKGHPFKIRDDEAMKALVESVKERGIDQPALVRPRDDSGYELVAGHRRQYAAELAGYANIPCVVRNMTDDEAVLAMTESNFNQRVEILPSERSQALKMQLEAIKHQGARVEGVASGDIGKRSNEIVADRNQMSIKNVQRYIALTNLTPDLLKLVDDKKIPFTPAVEMSYIKPKNQRYIAIAVDAQQSAPSLSQAQRMRELDQKGVLNGDIIDGIMLEQKKEETRVIFNSQELGKYFGPEKSPREIKEQIMKLLDDWKEKQPPEHVKPVKSKEAEK